MKSKALTKRVHRGGQWFTTERPNSINDPTGVFDLGGLILTLLFCAIEMIIVRAYRFILRLKSSPDKWEDYQGLVYCQICDDNVNFFTTIRGTSRILVKPPVIARSLADLRKFNLNVTSMSLTFCDGLEMHLYRIEHNQKFNLEEFKELVRSGANLM